MSNEFRWRSNGAVFNVVKNLEDVEYLLEFLFDENERISCLLDGHYAKFEDSHSEGALEDFSKITNNYMDAELSLRFSVDSAILLSIIDLESMINQFCYFNIGEVATESIESLSVMNKLEIIHKIFNLKQFKGTKPYESLKSLVGWRNRYAHGKNPEMPVKSLRKNHVEQPEEYKTSAGDKVAELIKQVENYIIVLDHLDMINKNEHIILTHRNHCSIEEFINKFKKVKFDGQFLINKITEEVENSLKLSVINFKI